MAMKPKICEESDKPFVPKDREIDILDCRVTVLEECCEEAKTKLANHEQRITKNEGDIANLNTEVAKKQNKLTAGSNIQISGDTISATDTKYSAGTGISLSGTQFSINATYLINQIHPVGDTIIRLDNTNPSTLYPGTTWAKVSEGKVLIGANSTYPLGSSANGSMAHSHSNPSTGASSAGSTGGHTLTAAQSGLRSHNHAQNQHQHTAGEYSDTPITTAMFIKTHEGQDISVDNVKRELLPQSTDENAKYYVYGANSGTNYGISENRGTSWETATNNPVSDTNATEAHSHSMAHTHAQGNTGEATIPYLAVNIWRRTA